MSGASNSRRRKSLSGITEGKQALIGVIDTSAANKEMDAQAFTSPGSARKKGGGGDDRTMKRRHSYQGVDLQLILQNSGESGGAVKTSTKSSSSSTLHSLRRVNSLGDTKALVRRGSRSDLFMKSSAASTPRGGDGTAPSTPLGTPRITPSMSRSTSIDSTGTGADSNDGGDMDFEESCVKKAQKAIKRMPGRSMESIKSNPKYGVMDASSKRGITLLTKHIALGGRDDANDIKKLKGHGISHVLNVAAQMPNFFQGEFVYMKIPLQDTDDANVIEIMPQAYDFIKRVESLQGRVLVHCISGVSRSTTVILMYLMQAHKMQLLQAYKYVHSCRPFIEPNKGFRLQLAEEELRLYRQSTVADKSAGPAWDFYEWNRKKEKVKIISANNKARGNHRDREHTRTDGCLEFIVRVFMS